MSRLRPGAALPVLAGLAVGLAVGLGIYTFVYAPGYSSPEVEPRLTLDPRIVYGGDASQRRSTATVIPWRELHEHTW